MLPFIYIYKFSADRFGNLEDGALKNMKLRKGIFGVAVLGAQATAQLFKFMVDRWRMELLK